jgi:UDP-N-acetylglucosamine 2-epimerase (non-hydrolysing)
VAIRKAYREVIEGGGKAGRQPEHWDGQAAQRIAAILARWSGQHE